jgi:hypothetical protein
VTARDTLVNEAFNAGYDAALRGEARMEEQDARDRRNAKSWRMLRYMVSASDNRSLVVTDAMLRLMESPDQWLEMQAKRSGR